MKGDEIFLRYQSAAGPLSWERYREANENVLVISPHPDDDALGAGGAMALASERGQGVFSVYMTDGGESPQKEPRLTAEEMAARREKEALASLRALGAVGGFFLRHQSRGLSANSAKAGDRAREEIGRVLKMLKPGEVYLPAPYERHQTHQTCTALALDALRSAGDWPLKVYGYSLWGSFWGGKERFVRDIGAVIRKKIEAVTAHNTQIEYKNFHQGILGKGNYEAVFWKSGDLQKAAFVEIFLGMTEFLKRKDLSVKKFIQEDVEEFLKAYLPG